MTVTDPVPRRGRYVEAARNDRLVLDAARAVFGAHGFDAPMSAVAQRAGVGIGSLYRRYGTKEELLQRLCVLAQEQVVEAARSALRHADPWRGLAGYISACVDFGCGAFAPVAGTIDTTTEMVDTNQRARRLTEKLVARAHTAGVLRPDVTALDIIRLIEQFSRRGAAVPDRHDDNTRQRLLAIALDGLAALDAPPLPGFPPSWAHYHQRWRRSG